MGEAGLDGERGWFDDEVERHGEKRDIADVGVDEAEESPPWVRR